MVTVCGAGASRTGIGVLLFRGLGGLWFEHLLDPGEAALALGVQFALGGDDALDGAQHLGALLAVFRQQPGNGVDRAFLIEAEQQRLVPEKLLELAFAAWTAGELCLMERLDDGEAALVGTP